MPLFITSPSAATTHGVYVYERQPPATVQAQGQGVAALVEQFPWGPDGSVFQPTDRADRINRLAPPGMSRTGQGYLAQIQKGFPTLKIVRVIGPTASAATATINKAGPVAMLTVTAKYKGTAGNSIVIGITAASDGDANHFNLTATVTGASGTTVELYENLNYSGTGSDSAPDFTNAILIGSIAKLASGIPIVGNTTMSTAVDGTVTASEYVGTQGAPDKGLSLLEAQRDVSHVFYGDPGNTLRAASNAGMKAHVDYMGDRLGHISGNPGQSLSAAQTDVANYRSDKIVYYDPWVYELDDTTGARQLVPAPSFGASASAQLSPSTSPAWKNSLVTTGILGGIVDVESKRGTGAAQNTAAGITTVIPEEDGGHSFEAAVLSIAPVSPTKKRVQRMRIGIYIAKSLQRSLRGEVDGPNVEESQQAIVDAVTNFLDVLVRNKKTDAKNLPHIIGYSIGDLEAFNPSQGVAAGKFTVPLNVQTSSGIELLFFSFQFGETVTVSVT